ncbi:hypothetical protein WA026_005349 [Henosepilachna vigintioctopunctata]|uniref:Uncharacterized protein n=1 Tax=Henosepilachna vigintioctopunctata TaxID=420089 RepID=A0AAW1U2W3_9CUCU
MCDLDEGTESFRTRGRLVERQRTYKVEPEQNYGGYPEGPTKFDANPDISWRNESVSAETAQVVSATPPIDLLLVAERDFYIELNGDFLVLENKMKTRNEGLQRRWAAEKDKAMWTRRLIGDIEPWSAVPTEE